MQSIRQEKTKHQIITLWLSHRCYRGSASDFWGRQSVIPADGGSPLQLTKLLSISLTFSTWEKCRTCLALRNFWHFPVPPEIRVAWESQNCVNYFWLCWRKKKSVPSKNGSQHNLCSHWVHLVGQERQPRLLHLLSLQHTGTPLLTLEDSIAWLESPSFLIEHSRLFRIYLASPLTHSC